ncbi:periplasmic heavy metal sensor [Albimonas sp. CAU 1670]|uniref:periplasmic heavy metal sensor n=1 Tax=Albimonas sp. CAU 1670 TaxID=3032599 RepID=UPI0023DAE156|nr:periplasmic heavy metal sensor [Albimonas sp. CAU 1670]MDF2234939.1 periplasmic heavy metal sensor [Albimonas sp. CAU 1670]
MTAVDADRDAAGPPPSGPRTGRTRRWVIWALAASVCVNLLLIGAAGGAFLRHGGPPPGEMPSGFDRVTLWRMFRALPPEARDDARDLIGERRDEMIDLARSRDAARARIAVAMEAAPFDPAALAAALNEARAAERRSRDLADALLLEVASDLSPATRAEIAEALRERRRKGFRHRWGEDHEPGRDAD